MQLVILTIAKHCYDRSVCQCLQSAARSVSHPSGGITTASSSNLPPHPLSCTPSSTLIFCYFLSLQSSSLRLCTCTSQPLSSIGLKEVCLCLSVRLRLDCLSVSVDLSLSLSLSLCLSPRQSYKHRLLLIRVLSLLFTDLDFLYTQF